MKNAIPYVTEVKVLPAYRLEVHFNDGFCRVVDMSDELSSEVFEPLKNPAEFARVFVDPVSRTVAWPSGVDLAPEWLYEPDPEKYRKLVDG
ncbi:MAG TPA: DUF2442 domain-containing protein [Dehalococcoidia bacterium]|nr:DUF2442 domain-containing protein [Dehalococcoidia bacterium]